MYTQPRGSTAHLPADDLFLFGRWPQLTSLTLTNLRCSPTVGFDAASTFLFAHLNLEVLHLDIGSGPHGATNSRLILPDNSLPRLRELRANKEIAAALLECPSDTTRPLETIKGVRLAGSTASNSNNTDVDSRFLSNLKRYGTEVKRIELAGWNEMEDIRRLAECAPRLAWLDVGKKGSSVGGHQGKEKEKTAVNAVEWATILSTLADLTTFHGVKFFYEVTAHHAHGGPNAAAATNISMADRSRIRKNDEIAPLLAWKCAKLRRVDHWEEGTGKVIVLIRDGEKDKVRWEVRRVKQA